MCCSHCTALVYSKEWYKITNHGMLVNYTGSTYRAKINVTVIGKTYVKITIMYAYFRTKNNPLYLMTQLTA